MNNPSLLVQVTLFSAVLAAVHVVLLLLLAGDGISAVLIGHLFFYLMSAGILVVFSKAVDVMIEKAGFVFIGLEFIKGGALVALLLVLERRGMLDNFMLANLMGIYLMHLFFSMFVGVRTLNEANKNITGK